MKQPVLHVDLSGLSRTARELLCATADLGRDMDRLNIIAKRMYGQPLRDGKVAGSRAAASVARGLRRQRFVIRSKDAAFTLVTVVNMATDLASDYKPRGRQVEAVARELRKLWRSLRIAAFLNSNAA